MAKVQYTKVTPIKKIDPVTFDLDGNEITVIQYLSSVLDVKATRQHLQATV